jgi:drug/metabolite transporter, DME family
MIGEFRGLGSAATWAAISTIMRRNSQHLSPVMLNGLRCVFAALTLAAIVAIAGEVGAMAAMPLSGAAIIVASGVLGQALGDGLYIWSLKLIGASRALPVSNVHPILTMVLAIILLGEPVAWTVLGGGMLVLGGVYLVAFPFGPLRGISHVLDTPDRRGLLLAVAAAGCWSLSTIMLKPALEVVSLLPANLLRLSTAAVLLIGLELVLDRGRIPRGLPHRSLAIMALAGSLNAFSSLLFLSAVHNAGAAKAAVLVATAPIFGLPMSIAFLNEKVNRRIIIGTLLGVLGIWLVFFG